ncbi:F-box/kelch-repeat protein [Dorcoceras hygrometricum]|uniref:F-box/kelch-repeat protein n=1 Tax=Dorcoceras hygrometricum TaxID=472368 RepID=A0A2Z7CQD2_9LAMI|nr:F-box/kelch-repeat protein [Dorcoceras hygrometricum]
MMRRRFVVATGSPDASEFRRYRLLLPLVLASAGLDIVGVDWCCRWTIIVVILVVASAIYRKTWSPNSIPDSILRIFSSFSPLIFRTLEHCSAPFVPYLLNPRTLFSRELSGDFPSFLVVVLLVRGRAAIPHSHLPAGIVATMCRVVNYHSSWARQQQVELFDASGNPGSTAGRGFNPAGGAPGGG